MPVMLAEPNRHYPTHHQLAKRAIKSPDRVAPKNAYMTGRHLRPSDHERPMKMKNGNSERASRENDHSVDPSVTNKPAAV